MIFAFLGRLGIPSFLIKPLLGGLAVLLIGLAVVIWFHRHDRKVVEQHEAGIATQVTTATNGANATANANDTKRQADNARADEQTKGVIHEAEAQHTEAARAPAGPVSRAAIGSLRDRAAKAGHAAH